MKLRRTISVRGTRPIVFPALEIKVTVPANVPDNVAGRWMGSFVLTEFLVAGKETPAQRCQKIEGAQWQMTLDLTPGGPGGGRMVVDLVPDKVPEGVAISRESLKPGTYSLAHGQFSGIVEIGGSKLPLSGQFQEVNGIWSLGGSGAVSQAVNEDLTITDQVFVVCLSGWAVKDQMKRPSPGPR